MTLAGLRSARLAPSHVVLTGALLAIVLIAVLAWLGTAWPWLGVQLSAAPSLPGIRIDGVDPHGPSAGRLHAGDLLVAIEGGPGERIALDAVTIARATYLLPTYAAFDAFIADHRALHDALRRGRVTGVLADGARVELEARATRPLRALPLDFWASVALAGIVLLVAFGVLAFSPREAASRLFFVACLGFAGTLSTMALILGRELSFDPSWSGWLWNINLIGRLVSHWGLLMIFWIYPRPFTPWRASTPVAAIFVLAWLATLLRWWPLPNVAAPLLSTLVVLVAVPLLATWQWRASRSNPLDRTVVKVMILSMAVPALLVIGLNQLPNMLWRRPLVESAAVLASISLLTYVGCAIGIARYRLFDLGRWWFEALVWGLGGALVVTLDALLLWLNASVGLAFGAALAIAGWLYFPLRQWLWRRVGPDSRQRLERHLPQLIDGLFGARSQAELHAGWQHLLEQVFAPLRSGCVVLRLDAPQVESDGLVLRIPALQGGQVIELEHANKGRRLFGSADVELARELLALTRRAAEARRVLDAQALEQSARVREKEAMLQDLHDGLGGLATNIRLLATLGQRSPPVAAQTFGTIGELADESLSEIRSFMYSLDPNDADWPALAADLRAFGRKLVEPHGLAFHMQTELAADAPPPDSLLRLNLSRICKESLNNVVKHARASRVQVVLRAEATRLVLRVHDDGIGLAPALLAADAAASGRSRGLVNLRRRAAQLGGTLAFEGGAGTTLQLELPLPVNSPPLGIAAAAAMP